MVSLCYMAKHRPGSPAVSTGYRQRDSVLLENSRPDATVDPSLASHS